MQIIEVPGVGEVEFPDGMDDGAISAAIQQMTGPATPPMAASHVDAATQANQALSSHGATPSARPEVGGGEAALRSFAQGVTAGYGDELGGATHALLGRGGTMGERYRAARDSERQKNAAAKQDHGGINFLGETAGAIANPLSKGRSFLAALGAGAAFGHGNSNAEDWKGQAKDTGIGAAFGAAGKYAGDALGAVARKAGPALHRAGVATGFRHLRARGGDISAKKPLSADSIIAAYEAGAFRPGTTVHFAAERLKQVKGRLGKRVGDLEDALAAAGVEGPERQAVIKEFEDEAARLQPITSAGDPRRDQMAAEVADLRKELPKPPAPPPPPAPNSVPPTQPMPTPPPAPLPPSKHTLSEILEKKRSAQWQASKEYDKLSGQLSAAGEGKKAVAAKYRGVSERAIDAQGPTKAPAAHAEWAPVNKQFGNIAGAEEVAAEGAARAKGRNLYLNMPNYFGGLGGVGAAVATGNPWALLAPVAVHELRTRGGSVATSALLGGSKLASKAAPALDSDPVHRALMAALLQEPGYGGNQ